MISRPIQQIPSGLLGFLQLKNMGQNPTDFPDSLQPILEMREWYFEAQAENLASSAAGALATGVGSSFFTTALRPPDGEAWFVTHFTITSSLVAGDTATVWPAFANPDTGTVILNAIGNPDGPRVGANRCIASARNFFLMPGGQLGFFYAVTAAVTITFTGVVRGVRLPL